MSADADVASLAGALHDGSVGCPARGSSSATSSGTSWIIKVACGPMRHRRQAAAILAASPALAQALADGLALAALPQERRWAIEHVPVADPTQDWLAVWEFLVTRPDGDQFYGPTIAAAAQQALAALEARDE